MAKIEEALQDLKNEDEAANTAPQPKRNPANMPWIAFFGAAICSFVFIAAWLHLVYHPRDADSDDFYLGWGAADAAAVWSGAYWRLITSTQFHIEPAHAIFNIIWLWRLGRPLEQTIGHLRFLIFYLVAAFVSSAAQLAMTGQSGIGASGIAYGLLGYGWMMRSRYPALMQEFNQGAVRWFLIWMVACYFLTAAHVANIGNTAHISGLIFGVLAGAIHAGMPRRHLLKTAMAGVIALCAISLVYPPPTFEWRLYKIKGAYARHDLPTAFTQLDKAIEQNPDNIRLRLIRAQFLIDQNQADKARADLFKIESLEPGYLGGLSSRIEYEQPAQPKSAPGDPIDKVIWLLQPHTISKGTSSTQLIMPEPIK